MARTQTQTQLRQRVRELGELREAYVTNTNLDRELNQSYLELFDKLVSAGSDDYFESTNNISVVADTASYALPTDYYKTIGVDVKLSNGNYVNISRYNKAQRNKYSIYRIGAVSREWAMYRIRGDNMIIVPTPNWTETAGIRHLYVAIPTLFTEGVNEATADAATLDGIAGWEDWLVYDCLIKFIGGKEEGDATQWEKMLAKLDQRIDDMKERDRYEPETIRDVDEEETERLWPKYGTPP